MPVLIDLERRESVKRFIIFMCTIFSSTYMLNAYSSQAFDIATMKCDEPSTSEEDEDLIVWLDGYEKGVAGETGSSETDIKQLGEFVEAECTKDPNQSILSVIKKHRLVESNE